MNTTLKDAVRVLVGSNIGKAGLTMLGLLVAVSVFVLATYPLDFGTREWSNPAVWADNPKAVPPVWLNLLPGSDNVAHATLTAAAPDEVRHVGSVKAETYRLPLSHNFDGFPTFISFSLGAVRFHDRPPLITLTLDRPDGGAVRLLQHVPTGGRDGEPAPYVRYLDTPYRILLSTDETVRSSLADFHNERYGTALDERDLRSLGEQAAFGTPDDEGDAFTPLQGEYEFTVTATFANEHDTIDGASVVIGGDVFGVMGSDSQGRDLAVGLLFGFPVALFIGLLASTLTTAIGASLGIMSGYLGGWVDTAIQRLADVVANVPLLPILIFMVIVLGSNLVAHNPRAGGIQLAGPHDPHTEHGAAATLRATGGGDQGAGRVAASSHAAPHLPADRAVRVCPDDLLHPGGHSGRGGTELPRPRRPVHPDVGADPGAGVPHGCGLRWLLVVGAAPRAAHRADGDDLRAVGPRHRAGAEPAPPHNALGGALGAIAPGSGLAGPSILAMGCRILVACSST